MEVTYKRHINIDKKSRVEFLLINFDYEDGNDYLAKIFSEKFGMLMEEKVDYIWFSVIKLHLNDTTYELLWHEDFGNIIYSIEQDNETISILEQRLKLVLDELNSRLNKIEGN